MADAVAHVEEALRITTAKRPYISLAAAASVGYILGGGLPGWAARAAASIAIRAAANAAMRHAVAQLNSTEEEGTP